MSVYELRYDYTKPPLTANQRLHWGTRANLTSALRDETRLRAKAACIPALGRCDVSLIWAVTTKHRRDADNVVPTLKAMCDGLVDAGVVTDDTPDLMVKHMPVIKYIGPGLTARAQHLLLIVRPLEGGPE